MWIKFYLCLKRKNQKVEASKTQVENTTWGETSLDLLSNTSEWLAEKAESLEESWVMKAIMNTTSIKDG